MRPILILSLLCACSHAQILRQILQARPAGSSTPAISAVNVCNAIVSGSNCTVTSIPSGHTLAVVVQTNATTNTFTLADGATDTFTQATSALLSGCGVSQDIWYVLSTGGSNTTVKVTTSGGGNWFGVVYDITGVTAFDTGNHVSSAANPNTPLTTANAIEVLLGVETANTSVTAVGGPWVQQSVINASGWGTLTTSSSGTYSMPFTSGGSTFCGSAAALK